MTQEQHGRAKRPLSYKIFFLAACSGLLACCLALDQWYFNQIGQVTTGEVVATSGMKTKHATVRFEAPHGNAQIFHDRRGSPSFVPSVGDKVEVVFHPAHPEKAYLIKTQWVGVQMAFFLAFFISVIGALVREKEKSLARRKRQTSTTR